MIADRFVWDAGQFTITRPAAKGDVEGHEFHGNRYTGGIGGEAALAHEVYASESAAREKLGAGAVFSNSDAASDYAGKVYDAYAHEGAAYRSGDLGSPIEVRFGGDPNQSGVARVSEGGSVVYPVITLGENMRDQLTVIHEVSHIIANEREQGLGAWKANHGGVFKDTFRRILQGEMAAHAEVMRSVERRPGKKGEGSGHAFRGNRWTGGIGGDGRQTTTPTARKPKVEVAKLRWETMNKEQKATIAHIGANLFNAARMGWRFNEAPHGANAMPAHVLYPNERMSVLAALDGLRSAGLDRPELLRALALNRAGSTSGSTLTRYDRTLNFLDATANDATADPHEDHYGLTEGIDHDKLAYQVAQQIEDERITRMAAESQGSHLATGKFPAYASESLGRAAALQQRDGSLFPERVTGARDPKLDEFPPDKYTRDIEQLTANREAQARVWDEHLDATKAVGRNVYDEVQRRLAEIPGNTERVARSLELETRRVAAVAAADEAYKQYIAVLDATAKERSYGQVKYNYTTHNYDESPMTPEEAAAKAAALARVEAADKAYTEAGKIRSAAQEAHNAFTNGNKLTDGLVTLKVLSEIRSFGYSEKEMKDNISKYTKAAARDSFIRAAAYYPREWYDRAFGKVKMEVGVSNTRPFCSSNLVKTYGGGGESADSTAVHETGHFMENYGGRSIEAAEYVYYGRRVGEEEKQSLRKLTGNKGYKTSEFSRPDTFADKYMGKDYGNKANSNYELLTMGMENLRNATNNSPATDADYQQFILGTLATL